MTHPVNHGKTGMTGTFEERGSSATPRETGKTPVSAATVDRGAPRGSGDTGRLAVVGLGSGEAGSLTLEVARELVLADTVVGYRTYMDMVRALLDPSSPAGLEAVFPGILSCLAGRGGSDPDRAQGPSDKDNLRPNGTSQDDANHDGSGHDGSDPNGSAQGRLSRNGSPLSSKRLLESGMRAEVDRCHAAFEEALKGHRVCLVCSGDPGLLAMAGLVLELSARNPAYAHVPVRVLPGVTAAFLAAASLGAPLQNGAILLSLSDLLVPAEEVLRNVKAALASALPVALYNPAGKKRRALLEKTLELTASIRGKDSLCALVRQAGKPDETLRVLPLSELDPDTVDMSSLLLLAGAHAVHEKGLLYETRGYADRYGERMEAQSRTKTEPRPERG